MKKITRPVSSGAGPECSDGDGINILRLRQDSLHWLDTDSGVVAFDLGTSEYISTNPSGALLWSKLSTGATRAELATQLVDEFGISQMRARADVDSFIAALVGQNLLEP